VDFHRAPARRVSTSCSGCSISSSLRRRQTFVEIVRSDDEDPVLRKFEQGSPFRPSASIRVIQVAFRSAARPLVRRGPGRCEAMRDRVPGRPSDEGDTKPISGFQHARRLAVETTSAAPPPFINLAGAPARCRHCSAEQISDTEIKSPTRGSTVSTVTSSAGARHPFSNPGGSRARGDFDSGQGRIRAAMINNHGDARSDAGSRVRGCRPRRLRTGDGPHHVSS
jgi:hypothetical protein